MEYLFPQAFYVLLAATAGLLGGWMFFRCWRALLPAGRSRAFWSALPETARRMVTTEEPSEVLRHYRNLIGTTARYAARSVGAVLVAILPTSALFLVLTALDPSERLTTRVEVHPASAVASAPDRTALAGKHVWCASTAACFFFEMMLFDTHDLDTPATRSAAVISRPVVFDRNPFWPYLNDLDFTFFAAIVAGSALAAWRRRARQLIPA
jgi:hypothetical protein